MDLYVGNLPINLDSERLKKLSVKKHTRNNHILSVFFSPKNGEKRQLKKSRFLDGNRFFLKIIYRSLKLPLPFSDDFSWPLLHTLGIFP